MRLRSHYLSGEKKDPRVSDAIKGGGGIFLFRLGMRILRKLVKEDGAEKLN